MIEDDLRATMLAHDVQAPGAAEFLAHHLPARRGQARWAAAGAAAAVAAIVIAVTLIWTRGSAREQLPTSSAALTCPTTYRHASAPTTGWVPADPTGIDGTKRLAPNETPRQAVVCAYLGPDVGSITGERALTGDLGPVTETLTWQPRPLPGQGRACVQYLAMTDGDDYLIGLTYADGTEWVSVPGDHCKGATNGEFETQANLRAYADDAYTSGHWSTTVSTRNAGGFFSPGRLGQETTMVPDGAVSLTVAFSAPPEQIVPRSRSATFGNKDDFAGLVRTLNSAASTASNGECDPQRGSFAGAWTWTLQFHYPVGPDVTVRVGTGCHPIDNGSLQADNDAELVPLIEKLLTQR